ncbi:MAG: hypothetical protein H6560_05125 [Lewinellaceae bacterium]|nr:hypothetical protein [Lewinellaceae bacterium]
MATSNYTSLFLCISLLILLSGKPAGEFLSGREEFGGGEKSSAAVSFFLLSPMGTLNLMQGEALSFEWTALAGYTGNYRLKILQQTPGAPPPDELPDTGLFFEESAISDTVFQYPMGAGVTAFSPGSQYAWQVETTELVDGQLQKSVNIGVIIFPLSCDFTLIGMPTDTLCPGDCFTLLAFFGGLALEHRVVLYADHNNLSAISVEPSGQAPFPLSELGSPPLESPPHYADSPSAVSFDICINEGAESPINFSAYYYQPGLACSNDPMGSQCCHDVESFEVAVADIPDFTNLELELQGLITGAPVEEICSGDPLLFSILNLPTAENTTLEWQYNDGDGMGWQVITAPPFSDYTFPVPAGHEVLSIDCGNNTDGYVERAFRAKLTIDDAPFLCEYFTAEDTLRICCPITGAALEITAGDDFDLSVGLCEGDTVSFEVELLPDDPFVSPPGEFVSIQWRLNGEELPEQEGQISFFMDSVIAVGAEDICLQAEVSNCAGKKKTFTQCINVDPQPVCDSIILKAPVLNPVEVEAGLVVYEACPNSAFTLEAIGFDQNTCVIQWEYSYDQVTWFPLGSSNTIQNTNLIIEGDATSIFYRVKCNPMSSPSACAPCQSDNIIEIREIQPPAEPAFIDCQPLTWCVGDVVEPYVTYEEPGVEYTWYVNGIALQESPLILEYTLQSNTCFQYTASNECYTITSNLCCLEVCEVDAAISCPDECPYPGGSITLLAGDSRSSCEESVLVYEWMWTDANGVPQTAEGSEISDIPPAGGTTYTLTVTDLSLGCSDTATLTIIPCDKQ